METQRVVPQSYAEFSQSFAEKNKLIYGYQRYSNDSLRHNTINLPQVK